MKKPFYWLAAASLAVAASGGTVSAADGVPDKEVWALLTGQLNNTSPTVGIVNYNLASPQTYTMVEENFNGNSLGAGVMVDGVFYWYEYTQQIYGYDAGALYAYDTDDGSTRLVADYGNTRDGVCFSSPTYDYQTKTVYALSGLMGGGDLVTVDLETGNVSKVAAFSGLIDNAEYGSADNLKAIAVNYDGDMYGVSYWGGLYKVNKVSGECSLIDYLDFNPEKAIMYSTCLAFDNDTNDLYWEVYTWVNLYKELRRIDIRNAKTEQIGIFGDDRLLGDFYIPFTVAEPGAPAKVSDFVVAPGCDGGLDVTLSWTNPVKTYGRGGTLYDISKIEVYRNNELIQTLTGVAPGEKMQWTDKVGESALYSYKVVAYNAAGMGDRCAVTMFVGQGIPMPVSNLRLVPENHGAKLTWDAPKSGKFDAFLDTESLQYEIVRSDGVTLTSDCKDTEFFDATIEKLARYSYTVTAHNIGGTSVEVISSSEVCGPSLTVPKSFFESQEDFDTWTNIDGNGNDMFWQYTSWPFKGATLSYSIWDQYPAHDYLISPKILLKKGQHYKVTFNATPQNKHIREIIAVSFGPEPTPERQDSVTQFEFYYDGTKPLRAPLPVVDADGEYNFGFVYRSYEPNYGITLSDIVIEEDHDGCLAGRVLCGGTPVAGARVSVADGRFSSITDANGRYSLDYILAGSYDLTVDATGYEPATAQVEIKELQTGDCDIELQTIPAHTISGKVIDSAGDPVAEATVTVGGYNSYYTKSAADGSFAFSGVFEHADYSLTVSRNNLLTYSASFDVGGDLDLGEISLADNLKAPRTVEVTDNGDCAKVEWTKPLNDPVVYRYDSGDCNRSLGFGSGTSNSVLGHINRQPSVLYGVDFLIMSRAELLNHYSVYLYVLDLDENGMPTDHVLYRNTYIPVTDDVWTSYTLPAPVNCPNGYMVGIAYSGFAGLGVDNGDDPEYPFVNGVNCFNLDYQTGNWGFLEDTEFKGNFAIRSVAAPYGDTTPAPSFAAPGRKAPATLSAADARKEIADHRTPAVKRAVEDRVRYNLYRAVNTADMDNAEWTPLAESVRDLSFDDTQWASLSQGVYRYGVKAVYFGGETSPILMADSIGKNMSAEVRIKVMTNTPVNEAKGASVSIYAEGGKFAYAGVCDAKGEVAFENVWKNVYNVTVSKDGFDSIYDTADFTSDAGSHDLFFNLLEDKHAPANLRAFVESEFDSEQTLVWDFPEVIFDGFEDHSDFAINSTGAAGWLYVDGDACETGGFSTHEWPNAFSPMAWMVFTPEATTPALEDYNLMPYEGKKLLTSFASYPQANDDWIISPRLYFDRDFKFNFYSKSYSSYKPETLQIGYSTESADTDDFIWLDDNFTSQGWWNESSFDIPAQARYVAIRNIGNGNYIAMLDNLRIGTPEAIASGMRQSIGTSRGIYEIYLDGEKIGETAERTFRLDGLADGRHIAGVRGSFKSGYTEMSTVVIDVTNSGVGMIEDASGIRFDGNEIVIDGEYTSASLYSAAGIRIADINAGRLDASHLPKGVYIVAVDTPAGLQSIKINLP